MTFDLAKVRADFPILEEKIFGNRLVYLDSGASAQKPERRARQMDWAHRHAYANVHRGPAHARQPRDRGLRGRPQGGGALAQCRPARGDHLHPLGRPRRSISSRRPSPPRGSGRATRSSLSIMEHHSNIVPWHFLRERQGAVLKLDRRYGRRHPRHGCLRGCHRSAHQDGRRHAHVERARHREPDRQDHRDRACQGRAGADRRQPGRGPHDGRRAGARRRFLRLHRPQALRPDRHRRALRQATICSPTCGPTRAAAR